MINIHKNVKQSWTISSFILKRISMGFFYQIILYVKIKKQLIVTGYYYEKSG